MISIEARVVDAVIDALADRSGFDHWWDNLPEEIRDDVVSELEQAVTCVLARGLP